MNVGDVIKNPVVIVGGIGLGLVLLMMRSAGASTPVNGLSVYNPGVQLDGAAYGYLTAQAANAAQLGLARFNTDATKTTAFFGLLANIDNNEKVVAVARVSAWQGIVQSQIQSDTAVTLDRQSNANKLSMGWINANVALHGLDVGLWTARANMAGAVAINKQNTATALAIAQDQDATQIQLATIQKKIAAKNSDNNLIGGVVKAAASILPFLF